MGFTYVTIVTQKRKPWVSVDLRGLKAVELFPLTPAGLKAAGKAIHEAGVETWTCSSSIDHPQDYKKGFRGDARQLIADGWTEEYNRSDQVHKSLKKKMLRFCDVDEFFNYLPEEEQKLFRQWVLDIT